MSSNSPFGKQADAQGGSAISATRSFDFQKRAALPASGSGFTGLPVSAGAGGSAGVTGIGGANIGGANIGGANIGGASIGGSPTRLDELQAILSSIDLPALVDSEAPNTLIIPIQGEPRFRIVAPQGSAFMMLVADVFKGNEQEIAQMAPSLLHANYTCQRLALEAQLPGLDMQTLAEDAEAQWLPVMGLDLERMTIVLSLQIPYRRVDDEDFGDFMSGLVETIMNDADVLVQQFKAITAHA